MRNDSNSVRNLVIGMLLVAVPFGAAYLLTRNNDNAQILLIVALFSVGLALTFAMASGLQQVGSLAIRLSGRSPLDILIVGLAALSLLTPWTIEIAMAHLHPIFGWTNPLGWLVAVTLLLTVMESARPYHGIALTVAGAALVAWVLWAGWLLTTPSFSKLPFTFMPVDLLSTGWYAGLIAWVIAVDAFASRRARQPKPAQARDVWPLALLAGMGLVRLGFAGRGRLWLGAAALVAAFIGISAVNDSEFSYWAHYLTLPPNRGRADVVIGAVVLGLVLIGSWFDTWRALRRRVIMGDWLAGAIGRSRSGTG
jgi:hypothetical protein